MARLYDIAIVVRESVGSILATPSSTVIWGDLLCARFSRLRLSVFLGAICAGATKAQERLIDFSSRGANVLGAPGARSLSLPSRAAPAVVVATFLRARGFRPETVASLVVKKAGRVSRTGITHLRIAQEVEGLAVYGTYVKAAVNWSAPIEWSSMNVSA